MEAGAFPVGMCSVAVRLQVSRRKKAYACASFMCIEKRQREAWYAAGYTTAF